MAAKKAGAIWEKEAKNGSKFLSHSMEFTTEMLEEWLQESTKDGIQGKVKVGFISFQNTPKPGTSLNPRAPQWNTMLSEPKDGHEDGRKAKQDMTGLPF